MLLNADSPEVRSDEVSRAMKRRSTKVDLQKSLALLDDAVGTPAPLQRSARKTPSALRRAMTPKRTTDVDKLDLTNNTSAPSSPGYSRMATKGSFMVGIFCLNYLVTCASLSQAIISSSNEK